MHNLPSVNFTEPPVRGYRIEKKGDDVTMALAVGDRDVNAFKVRSVPLAVQLGYAWERSL